MNEEQKLQHRLDRSLERQSQARTLALALDDELRRSNAPARLTDLSSRIAEILTDNQNFDPETGAPQ